MISAITDCVIDAMCGLRCLGCVRPSARGRTPSRPSEYMYRAVVLWNAIPQANEPVMMNQLSASFRNSFPNSFAGMKKNSADWFWATKAASWVE